MICVEGNIEKLSRTRLLEIIRSLQEKYFVLAIRAKSRQHTIIRMRVSQKKLRKRLEDYVRLVEAKKWGQ